MNRRNLFKNLSLLGLIPLSNRISLVSGSTNNFPNNERNYWIDVLIKIADPLLVSLSREELKKNMPVECKPGREKDRRKVTYLEAFGRLMTGIAPWLELGADNSVEGKLRKKYIELSQQCMKMAVDRINPWLTQPFWLMPF